MLSAPPDTRRVPAPRRVMAYCHDSVGIGHLRRTLSICERIGVEHPGTSFLLATGTPYVQLLSTGVSVDFIKLPALSKSPGGQYQSKYLTLPVEQMLRCRSSLLLETVRTYEPDMLLVDKAPLGVCRELVPALRWLRANRPHVPTVFGMRDIEDDAEAAIAQWTRDGVGEVIEQCYDQVWVYGMREVYDVVREYRLSERIAAKLRYTGYVTRPPCGHTATPRDGKTVLVTVGGGTDGATVLSTYLEKAARAAAQRGARSVIVGGPDLPADVGVRLKKATSGIPGATWLDFESCMSCRIRAADLVVCMGGYNTMCEVAVHGKPALIIPRIHPRLEQKIRAELWQRLGVVRMLAEPEFSVDTLTVRTLEMLDRAPTPVMPLDVGGLDRIFAEFHKLWSRSGATREAAHAPTVLM